MHQSLKSFVHKGSILILTLLISGQLFSQNEPYKVWMAREILKDSTFTGNIYTETLAGTTRFHWPSDLPLISVDNPTDGDHLFKTREGLYTALEATGRVYKIELDPATRSKLKFIRQDSTVYLGYNFGARVFFNRDTLYSLGGYGLWNFTWHLRYFRPKTHGWEVIPVNEPLTMIHHPGWNYLDRNKNALYIVEEKYFNEGIKSDFRNSDEPYQQTGPRPVYRLDLNSKDWKRQGMLNPELPKLFKHYGFIAETPWGNLQCGGDRVKNKCYLVNYSENKFYELRDKNLSSQIRDAALAGKNNSNPPERRLTYFHNDTLRFLNSDNQKYLFKITRDDFYPTPQAIWDPDTIQSGFLIFIRNNLTLIIGLASLLTGLFFFMRSQQKISETRDQENFDKQELQILRTMAGRPEMAIKPDELDELLGVEGRTQEALKKRRSILVRSINSKFAEMFEEEDELIRTERLESDRRMVRYTLNQKKLTKISKILKA